jgi:hypothetical protein
MKHCNSCNTDKELSEFYKDKNKSQGVGSTCKACLEAKKKTPEWKAKRKEKRDAQSKTTVKDCLWCNQTFELPKTRGQRDRKFCCTCETKHKSLFGDILSKVVGSSVSTARVRAKENNLPFDITTDYIYSIIPKDGLCPALKTAMLINTRYTLTIDKIIPDKGYTKGNVQILSLKANQMKNDATDIELLNFSNFIQRTHK